MAKEVLDTLYIAFKASGANEIRSLISNLEKDLDKFQKKINDSQSKSFNMMFKNLGNMSRQLRDSFNATHRDIVNGARSSAKAIGTNAASVKTLNKEIKKAVLIVSELKKFGKTTIRFDTPRSPRIPRIPRSPEETAEAERRRKEREEERERVRIEKERIRNIKNAINGVLKAMGFVVALAQVGKRAYNSQISSLQKNQSYYNKLFLSGIENAKGVNASVNIGRYGGSIEEVLASTNAISTSLGAMSRGDTSLAEHLGKYGIGGVNPKMGANDLIDLVKERIGRGDLSKNEINSLLGGLPFSEAMKMSVIKGNNLFVGENKAFEEKQANQESLMKAAQSEIDKMIAIQNVDEKLKPLTDSISDLISKNSELVAWGGKILPIASDLLVALGGLKFLFGSMVIPSIHFLGGAIKGLSSGIVNIISYIPKIFKVGGMGTSLGLSLAGYVGYNGVKDIASATNSAALINSDRALWERKTQMNIWEKGIRQGSMSMEGVFRKFPEWRNDPLWLNRFGTTNNDSHNTTNNNNVTNYYLSGSNSDSSIPMLDHSSQYDAVIGAF